MSLTTDTNQHRQMAGLLFNFSLRVNWDEVTLSSGTFAEVLWIQRQAVARKCLQEQLVAGPPARLRDARRYALHGGHALEEGGLAVEADQLVELGEDAVALDLLLLGELRHQRGGKST